MVWKEFQGNLNGAPEDPEWRNHCANQRKNSVKMRPTTVTKVMQRLMTKGYTKERKHNEMTKLRKVYVLEARHRKTVPESASRLT